MGVGGELMRAEEVVPLHGLTPLLRLGLGLGLDGLGLG